MMRRFLDPRRSRIGTIATLATLGLFTTTQNAFACLDLCASTFGNTFTVGDSQIWEIRYCTQRYNDGGGITTVCYYHVYEV
jgi:hypothetical protein